MLALRFLAYITLLTVAISPRIAAGDDPAINLLISQGDDADRKHATETAVTEFAAAEKLSPDNADILVRLSKQYSDLVSNRAEHGDTAGATKAAWTALWYAKRAVELAPNMAKAHLSLAICYGKLTDFVPNRTRVEYSRLIRDETQKSIDLDPGDDFAWHVMGRWNSGVANLNPALRVLCRVVYGGLPVASNEEAVRNLKKAVEIAPQRIIHHSELAKAYVAVGDMENARKEWRAVLELPAVDQEDERAQEAAKAGLKN